MSIPVSVLVPTHNRAELLCETLESIVSQSYAPAEIIVLDDGSVDSTRQAVARFGNRVTYRYCENGGICQARNLAASFASGKFLAFTDDDDLWRKDKLAKQMALHEADLRVEYSFTNFVIVKNGVWEEKTEFEHAPDQNFAPYNLPGQGPVVLEESFYDQILHFQPVRPSTIAISAQLFKQIGGFKEGFGRNPSEDVEFTLRCVQHPPIGIVREPVVGIRVHGGNSSTSEYRNLIGQMEVLEYALRHHSVGSRTRGLLAKEIELRRVGASYYAFREGDFSRVVSLVSQVSRATMDKKTRLKLWIARMPTPLARVAQKLLLKDAAAL